MDRWRVGAGQVESGQVEVESGQVESGQAEVEVESGQVESGQVEVECGQVESGQVEVDSGQADVESGQVEVESGQAEVESGQMEESRQVELVGSQTEGVGGGDMEVGDEDGGKKAPFGLKRKTKSDNRSKQAKKGSVSRPRQQSDSSSSDVDSDEASVTEYTESQEVLAYTAEKIRHFLQITKNTRGVKVGEHFPDEARFIASAALHMRQREKSGLTDQEVYRLRKICPLYYHTATHTHTHAGDDGGRCSLHFPILASSPRDSQEQWAASDAAPGDQVQVLGPDLVRVRDRPTSICSFCMFLLLGLYGGNPGEHGENMQTPHRKAREQAPTCCTMRDLNPRPSCCEATVLRTVPPCPRGER